MALMLAAAAVRVHPMCNDSLPGAGSETNGYTLVSARNTTLTHRP
jgi:hypothetical protein